MTDIHPQDRVAVNVITSFTDMFYRKSFGETLRSLRGCVGLSRRELASRAGLSLFWVADLERGMLAPTEDDRAALERAIGCPLYYGTHEKQTVRVGERVADIDVGIAPLIRELWVAGIGTFSSCQQDSRGRIAVEFRSSVDAEKFLYIVARHAQGDNNLYWRIRGERRGEGTLPAWECFALVEDLLLNDEFVENCAKYSYEPPDEFRVMISVRFPPQDLPIVLQRLRDHNASHGKDRGNPFPRRTFLNFSEPGQAQRLRSVFALLGADAQVVVKPQGGCGILAVSHAEGLDPVALANALGITQPSAPSVQEGDD
jgi:transcriptional regulator with XRE-family HTH domain